MRGAESENIWSFKRLLAKASFWLKEGSTSPDARVALKARLGERKEGLVVTVLNDEREIERKIERERGYNKERMKKGERRYIEQKGLYKWNRGTKKKRFTKKNKTKDKNANIRVTNKILQGIRQLNTYLVSSVSFEVILACFSHTCFAKCSSKMRNWYKI